MEDKTLQHYIPLIVTRLKPINPAKIILFGSYAGGSPGQHSDIDLLVVVNNDDLPQTFKDMSRLHLEVSRQLRDIRGQVPIDLIVQTKPMHQKFMELDSIFSREIAQKGVVIYETGHSSLAG